MHWQETWRVPERVSSRQLRQRSSCLEQEPRGSRLRGLVVDIYLCIDVAPTTRWILYSASSKRPTHYMHMIWICTYHFIALRYPVQRFCVVYSEDCYVWFPLASKWSCNASDIVVFNKIASQKRLCSCLTMTRWKVGLVSAEVSNDVRAETWHWASFSMQVGSLQLWGFKK